MLTEQNVLMLTQQNTYLTVIITNLAVLFTPGCYKIQDVLTSPRFVDVCLVSEKRMIGEFTAMS